jgi:cytochrome P450
MAGGFGARAGRLVVRALTRPVKKGGAIPRIGGWLPFVGAPTALLVDAIEFQRRGHAALGDVFATKLFGMDLVFVGGPEAIARFGAAGDELDVIAAYKRLLGRLLGEDVFTQIGSDVLRALSGASVRRQSAGLGELATELVRRRVGDGGEIDLLALSNGIVMHMACRFVCGERIDRAHCDELAELFHLLESDFSIAGMFLPIETPSLKRRKAARERILAIFEDEVRRAAKEGTGDPDGYMEAVLVQSMKDRSAPTDAEVHQGGLALMGAVFGAHTNTAMSLASSLADLLAHPEVLARVEAEQHEVLSTSALDLGSLCRMPLLLRAINESMRLHGNGGLWRMTTKDVEIGGYTVAAGTLVGTSMGLVNLDAQVYADAMTYDPDRYARMQVDELQSPPLKDRRFGVFGVGKHLCPGRRLAYTMVGMAIVVLLREYRLELVTRPHTWFTLMTAGMARPLGRLVVRAEARADSPR